MKPFVRQRLLLWCLVLVCVLLAVYVALQVVAYMQPEEAADAAADQPYLLIDPGHGGMDGGAQAADGTLEKDINLAIALPLADMLRVMGYPVRLTRDSDVSLDDAGLSTIREKKVSDMKHRLAMFNDSRLVISIHVNKFEQPQYYGTQIFYAAGQNESFPLATSIREAVLSLLQPENKRELKKGTKDIYLLHNTQTPAVLVECGFLSNAQELQKLKDTTYQQQMAYAILCGTLAYQPG